MSTKEVEARASRVIHYQLATNDVANTLRAHLKLPAAEEQNFKPIEAQKIGKLETFFEKVRYGLGDPKVDLSKVFEGEVGQGGLELVCSVAKRALTAAHKRSYSDGEATIEIQRYQRLVTQIGANHCLAPGDTSLVEQLGSYLRAMSHIFNQEWQNLRKKINIDAGVDY